MILNVKNLSCFYGDFKALENVSFSLKKGEFIGIIGPNGGGKSTLFKCILNLYQNFSGQIELFTRKISFVPQFAGLNPAFATSVMQVILSGAVGKNSLFFASRAEKIRAEKMLELVNMRDFARANIHELSGGQAQRVLIARALMGGCELLLLDEPTASIDVSGKREIFLLLSKLNLELNLSLLCICHDLALISAFAGRILHINQTAHFHEFCEHEKAAKLAEFARSAKEFCEIDALRASCDMPH